MFVRFSAERPYPLRTGRRNIPTAEHFPRNTVVWRSWRERFTLLVNAAWCVCLYGCLVCVHTAWCTVRCHSEMPWAHNYSVGVCVSVLCGWTLLWFTTWKKLNFPKKFSLIFRVVVYNGGVVVYKWKCGCIQMELWLYANGGVVVYKWRCGCCEAHTCYSAELHVPRQTVTTSASQTRIITILLCSLCTLARAS